MQRATAKPFARLRRGEIPLAANKDMVLETDKYSYLIQTYAIPAKIRSRHSCRERILARRENIKNPVLHTENGQADYFFSSLVQWGQRVASSGISLRQ